MENKEKEDLINVIISAWNNPLSGTKEDAALSVIKALEAEGRLIPSFKESIKKIEIFAGRIQSFTMDENIKIYAKTIIDIIDKEIKNVSC